MWGEKNIIKHILLRNGKESCRMAMDTMPYCSLWTLFRYMYRETCTFSLEDVSCSWVHQDTPWPSLWQTAFSLGRQPLRGEAHWGRETASESRSGFWFLKTGILWRSLVFPFWNSLVFPFSSFLIQTTAQLPAISHPWYYLRKLISILHIHL